MFVPGGQALLQQSSTLTAWLLHKNHSFCMVSKERQAFAITGFTHASSY